MPLVGTPRVEWCSKRNIPHKGVSMVYIKLSGKKVVLYPHSSNKLQKKNNCFASPTNCGVCDAPIAYMFTK
jgi:hypothetical protein